MEWNTCRENVELKDRIMNLNELKDRAYSIAKAHGWHEQELSDEHCLMLIITEISEAVQADRDNRHADIEAFKKYEDRIDFKENFERQVKNTVEDELADVVIRCLDLAGLRQFDLSMVREIKDSIEELKPDVLFSEVCYNISGIVTAESDTVETRICAALAVVIKYCEGKGIDLDFFVEQKMKYNELRSYKHGNKKY